ncbi:carbohydrate-binding domain-containing protein [Paeniglutamicibacter sp. Y32M11]|uniref:carbohydrate-binding domain-containing protein n=1 Tax=Paeniglutamicibacter sp. Y32M11 TaxID=2853258 RepID=UPI001C52887C|nr:carbohydrate-binding domain-containing protein [Paeniglutamicibacter sp. Y32M11]QXQ09808.1 carbohydrate-binding domain-containing protein [Paeniglutamicibacter sp. Y32M11]
MARKAHIFSIAALSLSLLLAGCSTDGGAGALSATATTATTAVATTNADTSTDVAADTHFDSDDLVWDSAKETDIALADGASTSSGAGATIEGDKITISEAGDYRISGSLSDGNITISAPEEAAVRLIFDNASISNSTGSPLVVTEANEVLLYLQDGTTNKLSDANEYSDTSEDAANATIYSKADFTIAGDGSLDVAGNFNDAINVSDGLVIASGTINTTSVDDGIRGKDYVAITGGTITVDAGDDGVKSDNEEDEGRGWLLVQDGTLKVSAADDGVKAYNKLAVTGGKVTVSKSAEGLEAANIALSGGVINVTASDDGLNASGGSTTTETTSDTGAAAQEKSAGARPAEGAGGTPPGGGGMGGGETVGDFSLVISGGEVTVMADGDGLDSNGTASVTGGTTVINGPTNDGNAPIDVNGDFTVTGGTIAAAGSSGMAVTPGEASTQSGLQAIFDTALPKGTVVQISNTEGETVAAFTTTRETASLIYSGAGIVDGESYTFSSGGSSSTEAGLGQGSGSDTTELVTVTAGEYSEGMSPGGARG